MKQKNVLFSAVCCFMLQANAQISNNTIVNDSCTWATLSYVYGADENGNTLIVSASTEFDFLDGDSVFNKKNYKKVFSYRDELHLDRFFVGLIREENKKTYFAPYEVSLETLFEESVLYDFSLEKGDTFEYVTGFGDYIEITTLCILESDSVLVNNEHKKRLIIAPQSNHEWVIDTIIENVGSLHGLLYPLCYMCTGSFHELLCFTQNNELLYQNPKRSKCYYDDPNELTSLQTIIINDYSVFPNPVGDVFSCSDNTITRLEIFDISGKKVYSQTYEDIVDVSSFSSGLYLLKIYNSEDKVSTCIMIKK
jgi:hypothetical protein